MPISTHRDHGFAPITAHLRACRGQSSFSCGRGWEISVRAGYNGVHDTGRFPSSVHHLRVPIATIVDVGHSYTVSATMHAYLRHFPFLVHYLCPAQRAKSSKLNYKFGLDHGKLLFSLNFSSLLGQTTYLSFYVDWLIEVNAISVAFIIVSVPTSIYIGLFVHIHAMVGDMSARLRSIDTLGSHRSSIQRRAQPSVHRIWSMYVQEFVFHQNIFRYACI